MRPLEIPKKEELIAMLTWKELIWGNLRAEEAGEIRMALLDYCELDTMAMVETLKFLYSI